MDMIILGGENDEKYELNNYTKKRIIEAHKYNTKKYI